MIIDTITQLRLTTISQKGIAVLVSRHDSAPSGGVQSGGVNNHQKCIFVAAHTCIAVRENKTRSCKVTWEMAYRYIKLTLAIDELRFKAVHGCNAVRQDRTINS